jgi:flagellar L-ring protein precursor FlgH
VKPFLWRCVWCVLLLAAPGTSLASKPKTKKSSGELRADYVSSVVGATIDPQVVRTRGSLWFPDGPLNEGSADYKAHALNDLVTLIASVQTTASQSGTVDSSRNFSTNSAITGVFGNAPSATNPLLAANSSTALKGAGTTASNTAFSTSLAGQVIAVLSNGNLVIEAHSQIDMNNEHEEVIVRGVARPGDITPANTIASASLSSLQIELKGKGIISNSVRPPNVVTRAILRLFGF